MSYFNDFMNAETARNIKEHGYDKYKVLSKKIKDGIILQSRNGKSEVKLNLIGFGYNEQKIKTLILDELIKLGYLIKMDKMNNRIVIIITW